MRGGAPAKVTPRPADTPPIFNRNASGWVSSQGTAAVPHVESNASDETGKLAAAVPTTYAAPDPSAAIATDPIVGRVNEDFSVPSSALSSFTIGSNVDASLPSRKAL